MALVPHHHVGLMRVPLWPRVVGSLLPGEIDVDMRGSYISHSLLNKADIAKKATAWLREKVYASNTKIYATYKI